jgi:hypothetical protein
VIFKRLIGFPSGRFSHNIRRENHEFPRAGAVRSAQGGAIN